MISPNMCAFFVVSFVVKLPVGSLGGGIVCVFFSLRNDIFNYGTLPSNACTSDFDAVRHSALRG